MRRFYLIIPFSILVLVDCAFAGRLHDAISTISDARSIATIFGVSTIGLFGIVLAFRKAIKEIIEAIECTRTVLQRYNKIPELVQLRREWSEALDALAKALSKIIVFKRLSRRVQNLSNDIRKS